MQTQKNNDRGRPTALTPEVHEKIVMAIRAGNYVETAAGLAGIHKDSFYAWLKMANKERDGIYRRFSDDISKAIAEAEARDVALIARASLEQWQAAAWRLERRYPDRWGRRDRMAMEHSGRVTERKEHDITIRLEQVAKEYGPLAERIVSRIGSATSGYIADHSVGEPVDPPSSD